MCHRQPQQGLISIALLYHCWGGYTVWFWHNLLCVVHVCSFIWEYVCLIHPGSISCSEAQTVHPLIQASPKLNLGNKYRAFPFQIGFMTRILMLFIKQGPAFPALQCIFIINIQKENSQMALTLKITIYEFCLLPPSIIIIINIWSIECAEMSSETQQYYLHIFVNIFFFHGRRKLDTINVCCFVHIQSL